MRLIDKLLFEKGMKEERKITQLQASKEIGITVVTFHQLLTGKTSGVRETSKEQKIKIAEYFGITPEQLESKIQEEISAKSSTD